MSRDYFVKYGGAAFRSNVDPEQIHSFVRQLSREQKKSVQDVIQLLEEQGYLSKLDDERLV